VGMNILRIDGWDGPTVGGAQMYVRRVSQALDALGHRTLSAAIVTDPVPEKLGPVREFRVPRSPVRQAVAELADGGPLTRWLDGIAAEFRPDVIHLHHFETGFAALGPWLGRREEPVFFTAHDAELVCPVATLTLPDGTVCPGGILPRCQFTGCEVGFGLPLQLARRRSFDNHVKSRVRAFICVSTATQRVFENLGYRPTALLRPLIPLPDSPVGPPSGPFTVGFLGRFERQKGIPVLLEAFAKVREKHPDIRLRFAGSGPLPIRTGNGVVVDGWIPDSHRWFEGIHLLVVPSLPWENLGNSPIEALGSGVPVIVTDSGGLPETVGNFGTVVAPGDADALAGAIENVIDRYHEARVVAQAGREWVREEFSTDRHIGRLLDLYSAATNRGAPTGGA